MIELSRAVAVAMAYGPARGLDIVDALSTEPAMRDYGYHLLPTVRADLLAKLGRTDQARAERQRAASLAGTPGNARCCSTAPTHAHPQPRPRAPTRNPASSPGRPPAADAAPGGSSRGRRVPRCSSS